MPRFLRLPSLVVVPALLAVLAAAPTRGDDLAQRAAEVRQRFAAQLEELAAACAQQGLAPESAQTRAWCGQRDPYRLRLARLPREVGAGAPPADAPAAVAQWHERFMALRRAQAEELFQLARAAIRAKHPALAYDLVLSAIREDPDHAALRKMLGYQQLDGQWRTHYEAAKLRGGRVWDDRFGWLAADQQARYRAGERSFRGRWISAEEDARLHAEIRNGWRVETEHYLIVTNHSLEAGVALSDKLESLYRVWQQLFVSFTWSDEQLLALFEGRGLGRRSSGRKHEVYYFRDRDDYLAALARDVPGVEQSIGVYVGDARRAYFFAGEEANDRTLFHEATHQLFHEVRPVDPQVGERANFWIVEGIAMFLESLRVEPAAYVLGGFDDPRLHAARYRLLADDFYVPLAQFTSWGMESIQNHPRIATLYSQAAGLTHFLVFHSDGTYREALLQYLLAVYAGRDTPDTLSRLTGASYEELDRQYRQFMEESMKLAPPAE